MRAVHTHLPPANACALIGAVVRVVHRTWAGPACHRAPPGATASRRFVTTPDRGFQNSALHSLRPRPAQRARIWQSYIVHRTSYIGGVLAATVVHPTSYIGRPRLPPPHRPGCFGDASRSFRTTSDGRLHDSAPAPALPNSTQLRCALFANRKS